MASASIRVSNAELKTGAALPLDIFLAVLAFALDATWTPGSNSLMLASSGVNFGFWRTLPHLVGIQVGLIASFVVVLFADRF